MYAVPCAPQSWLPIVLHSEGATGFHYTAVRTSRAGWGSLWLPQLRPCRIVQLTPHCRHPGGVHPLRELVRRSPPPEAISRPERGTSGVDVEGQQPACSALQRRHAVQVRVRRPVFTHPFLHDTHCTKRGVSDREGCVYRPLSLHSTHCVCVARLTGRAGCKQEAILQLGGFVPLLLYGLPL